MLAPDIGSEEIKKAIVNDKGKQIFPDDTVAYNGLRGAAVEYKPHFHEWATVMPGMICLSRKKKTSLFRNYTAAETASPVIGCCAGLRYDEMHDFFFAGICRSKSVRSLDDGVGPKEDEYFTIALGGMITMLNNSDAQVFPGDILEWTFFSESSGASAKRAKQGPRRVGIAVCDPSSPRVIGRCLSFAKPGETFDLLIKAT